MTSKELAEVAGINVRNVNNLVKKLYPEKVFKGKRTHLTELEAMSVMQEIQKRNFVSPTNLVNFTKPPSKNYQVNKEDLISAFIDMAVMLERYTKTNEERLLNIEQKISVPVLPLPLLLTHSPDEPSFYPKKQRVQNLINDYHIRTKKPTSTIRDELYGELYKYTGFDVTSRYGVSPDFEGDTMDYVEDQGFLGRLEQIAKEYLQ